MTGIIHGGKMALKPTLEKPAVTDDPMRIQGLDHVVLRCTDLQAMLKFYQTVLGCTLERERPDLGLYQLRAGSALIDLVPVGGELGGDTPPEPAGFNMAHFCLRIELSSWEAIRDHLASHGIAWETPQRRYGADGNGLSVYLSDPGGNTVELKGPPEPG